MLPRRIVLYTATLYLARALSVSPRLLVGDWASAKAALQSPDCCVVSVSGLEPQLRVLQQHLADNGPADMDLRSRVRGWDSRNDCLRVRRSVSSSGKDGDDHHVDPCIAPLEELAHGMASLADGPLEGKCDDVLIRIVCASDYRANIPPYHTDKAPLRGYVTLRGVGTEYMTRPCSPLEYMTLRSLGEGDVTNNVRSADELEFIVMKGDYYEAAIPKSPSSWLTSKIWQRASACVHRSPPGNSGRRVIISFDLADGDDDREWYQAERKRKWRSGMTQRKLHFVA